MKNSNDCRDCQPDFMGEIGKCKRHTRIHTIQHQGFLRWLRDEVSARLHISNFVGVVIIKALQALLVIAVVAIVVVIVETSLNASEVQECKQLAQYSRTLKEFYIVEWQSEMCKYHRIDVPARVVGNNEL